VINETFNETKHRAISLRLQSSELLVTSSRRSVCLLARLRETVAWNSCRYRDL